jgi:hypothetical protein
MPEFKHRLTVLQRVLTSVLSFSTLLPPANYFLLFVFSLVISLSSSCSAELNTLLQLYYVDADNAVQLKGRVAREVRLFSSSLCRLRFVFSVSSYFLTDVLSSSTL